MSLVKKIFKYELAIQNQVAIKMPLGADILSLGNQNEQLVLWALIDPRPETRTQYRVFRIIGTGHPIPDWDKLGKFLGTVQFRSGMLVFHVFEIEG